MRGLKAHCLINVDTVAHGKAHESEESKRIPREDALPLPSLSRKSSQKQVDQ